MHPAHGPDPVDGLRLALLQRRREQLRARATGRTFGLMEGLLALMLVCGIVELSVSGFGSHARVLRFAVGLLLVVSALLIYVTRWFSALEEARRLDEKIAAQTRSPEGSQIEAAAAAARTFLVRDRR